VFSVFLVSLRCFSSLFFVSKPAKRKGDNKSQFFCVCVEDNGGQKKRDLLAERA
jgi:hypothetical protein